MSTGRRATPWAARPSCSTSTITITDPDNATLASATVTITNFQSGDALNFTAVPATMGNIAIQSNVSGVLTLTSAGNTATLAQWEAALEAVSFSTTSSVTTTRTVSFVINDGLTNSPADTATVSVTVPTFAPYIVEPDILYWSGDATGDQTPINRISFQDRDSVASTVRVTLAMDDNGDALSASSGGDITVVSGSGTQTLVLEGTIAAINAFLYAGAVQWNPDGSSNGETGTLTVMIDDNGSAAGGNVASTTVNISEISPSFTDGGTGNSTNDFSNVNLNDISTEPDGSAGTGDGNDTMTTSWWHQPSSTTVTYNGGGSGTDTVTLVFTPDQLAEILASTSDQNDLRTYLTAPTGDSLSLNDTSWNADVTGFETANISLATGYGNGTVSVNSVMIPTPPADTTPDADTNGDLVIGDSGANTLTGGAGSGGNNGNDVLVGLGGNDNLSGGSGADLLLGGSGNDTLTGGTGNDVLSGSGGTDTFTFAETGAANADAIVDYSFVEGDVINLSSLLDGPFGGASVLSDFARVTQSGNNIVVQVDTDGGANSFVDVATLSNYGTGNADLVRVFFEGQNWVLTA